ncbi:sugar ABC transporter substrate-binding protein [Streptomyces sp. SID3343]|uniref:ABC transporter substrate-binding protein n=1 Tax=Streptomyces sp. SID3343 TaxID=2690260 RepID=UPI00136CB5B0|nr:sugar ABC transporter substrate-binding protein [Streptomyces sp. SID3343]MYW06658.1 extracellular solute-binding protein [Streptomyces sp. SID3343]
MQRTSKRTSIRLCTAIVGIVTSLSLVTGCGGGGDDDKKKAGAADSGAGAGAGQTQEISFWSWTKGTQEVVDAFNKSHPDIRVKYEQIPSGNAGGYAKMSNAVKAGNAPDVLTIEYPQLPDFVSQGAVQDLSAKVSGLKAKFPAQVNKLTELGGKTWAVPLDAAPMALYYRTDFFTEHNIPVPKTWDEYRAAAEQVKAADAKARIGTFFPDDPSTLAGLTWQAGGSWFATEGESWKVSLTDEKSRQVGDFWNKLVADDLVRVQPSFSQQWNADLKSGGTVGIVGAAWSAGVLKSSQPDLAGKWAVAPLPDWGTPANAMLGGSTFAVSKDSKKTKAALTFIEWMTTTKEGIAARIASGTSSAYPASTELVPGAAQAFDTAFFGKQDIYSLFTDAAGKIGTGWTWGPSMTQTNTVLKDQLGKLSSGGSVTGSLEEAQKATVDDLKKRGISVKS